MTFPDALHEVFHANARITRRMWNNPRIYCYVEDEKLCIKGFDNNNKPDDGLAHPWIVTSEDYFATDWETVDG